MKIHELAQKTDLAASAIRYYEQQGLLDKRHVKRESNNYREYREEAVPHIQFIKRMQAAGFSISELKDIVKSEGSQPHSLPKAIEVLKHKMLEIHHKQDELIQVQQLLAKMLANKYALLNDLDNTNIKDPNPE